MRWARLNDVHAARLFPEEGLDAASVLDMESRRRFWEDGIPDADVAIDEEGIPCFVQWAIPGEHAELVNFYFGDGFPERRPDEMLLEGAWARPEARGKRITAEAMSRITLAGASRDLAAREAQREMGQPATPVTPAPHTETARAHR